MRWMGHGEVSRPVAFGRVKRRLEVAGSHSAKVWPSGIQNDILCSFATNRIASRSQDKRGENP